MMEMMMGALMGGGPGGVGMLLGGKGKGKARKAAKRAAPPPEPEDDGEDDEEAGAFRLVAITKSQRVRKNMDKLYRALEEIEGLMADIDEMEGKLDSLGEVDVNELYESWGAGDTFSALAAWAQERAGASSVSTSGFVVGHVDDLSDEEIEALQSGMLSVPVGVAGDEG